MTTDIAVRESNPLGWTPPPDLTFERYVEAGRQLAAMNRACQFWLGDWVNYGEAEYGEKYDEAVEATGYDYGTLRNYASVAARIPLSRRRDNLTFSHYQEVVKLPEPEQEQWLDRAERDQLSHKQLRAELKAASKPTPPAPDPPGVPHRVTLTLLIDAIDEQHAHTKAKELATLLERRGANVTHKQVARA